MATSCPALGCGTAACAVLKREGRAARRGGRKGGATVFLFLFSVVVGGADQPAPENIDVDVDCLAAGSPDLLASDRPAARRRLPMSPRSIKHTYTHTHTHTHPHTYRASHRIHLPLWTGLLDTTTRLASLLNRDPK